MVKNFRPRVFLLFILRLFNITLHSYNNNNSNNKNNNYNKAI